MSPIEEYIKKRSTKDPEFKQAIEKERVLTQAAVKIYELRAELNLSQRAFADLVGKPQSTIARIENGAMYSSTRLLSDIAEKTHKKLIIAFQ